MDRTTYAGTSETMACPFCAKTMESRRQKMRRSYAEGACTLLDKGDQVGVGEGRKMKRVRLIFFSLKNRVF